MVDFAQVKPIAENTSDANDQHYELPVSPKVDVPKFDFSHIPVCSVIYESG